MITSPFPPSKWDLIDGIRRENPTLTEAQAAYRLIDEKDATILDLTAQRNAAQFREQLWRYLLIGLMGAYGIAVITFVVLWVRR